MCLSRNPVLALLCECLVLNINHDFLNNNSKICNIFVEIVQPNHAPPGKPFPHTHNLLDTPTPFGCTSRLDKKVLWKITEFCYLMLIIISKTETHQPLQGATKLSTWKRKEVGVGDKESRKGVVN